MKIAFPPIRTNAYLLIFSAALIFLLNNFNESFGYTFLFLLLLDVVITKLVLGERHIFEIEQDTVRLSKDFLIGAAMFGGYAIASVAVTTAFGQYLTPLTLNSVIGFISSTLPPFAASTAVAIIAYGVVVGTVESSITVTYYEAAARAFGIDVRSVNGKSVGLMAFIAIIVMIIHLKVRQIAPLTFDTAGLVVTFLFFFLTLLFVTLGVSEREKSKVIWMHIIGNTLALSVTYGLFPKLNAIIASFGV